MDIQPAYCSLPRPGLRLVNSQFPTLKPVSISGLSVYYQQLLALDQISAEFYPGRVTGIIGPNGAGKSTLLQAMLGLIPTASGTVRFGSQTLADQRHQVAYVPQRSQIDWLYPATVWDVVLMGRVQKTGWFRRFSAASRQQARAALERVGMAELRNRPIGQLSGGQQQRVFLARSLAQEADVFCFDEPFVGVDQKTETVLFEIFHELADAGKTVIVVNHDLGEAITNFDDLLLLNRSLIASGPRQQVLNQENLRHAYGGTVSFYAA
ncbi:metal ABC transporter ATP-binding protein [Romeria aff. gracilis LEGE 07310]|uniref:Metal ABC transporter ATP-binding protein n=1 Tax=Vasconcelosia minhoensis LEGE 07310 TaxID=915328 RepID=A0A8J7AGZ9_9CYAN|nr:metal ABC transporter ATP-binding protein [Romeria gracilis]MBE9077383.1 metal ABC transporter ATP-binding protein [Romeria aff. gracilis LEGE 07310]